VVTKAAIVTPNIHSRLDKEIAATTSFARLTNTSASSEAEPKHYQDSIKTSSIPVTLRKTGLTEDDSFNQYARLNIAASLRHA
jgi:hypothetical protein